MRILPKMCDMLWPDLLAHARLTGDETDPESLRRLLDVMEHSGEPVLRVCATSLKIRLRTFECLTTDEAARDVAPELPIGRVRGVEVALLDRAGVITRVNPAWTAFAAQNDGDPARTGVGVSYLEICQISGDALSLAVAAAIRAAIRGDLPGPLSVLLPCHSDSEQRWYDVLISSRLDADARPFGATVTLSAAPLRRSA
jgi:hypothetical protein